MDQNTFKILYDQYWEKVFGTCYNHCKDVELSYEMVQEIFCSLWERRDVLTVEGSIENYLVKAAKYKVIDYFRKKANQVVLVEEEELESVCNSECCTENDVLYHLLNERVGNLVDQLPCQCRQVYRLSREQGLDTKEIASALLISEKTVKNHLTKALTVLRLSLQDYR